MIAFEPEDAWVISEPGVDTLWVSGTCAGQKVTVCVATTDPNNKHLTFKNLLDMREQFLKEITERCWKKSGETRQPAFHCENCGGFRHFSGMFSRAAFEWQHEQFRKLHADCLPILNGGCI